MSIIMMAGVFSLVLGIFVLLVRDKIGGETGKSLLAAIVFIFAGAMLLVIDSYSLGKRGNIVEDRGLTALSPGGIYKTICKGIIGQKSVAVIMDDDGNFLAYEFQKEPAKTFVRSNDKINPYVPVFEKESEREREE